MTAIRIVEVGPRDGLQNEKVVLGTDLKISFIQGLVAAGIREIEATSFVSPRAVPQLADADSLWPLLPSGPLYSALVPNMRGLERALALGVDRIAVFTGASEAFVQRNIGMSISHSLDEFGRVVSAFRAAGGGYVRGYVSTAFECPYAGKVSADAVISVVSKLFELGVDEVSIGDTIGVAVPNEVRELAQAMLSEFGSGMASRVAWHFHDTWGMGVANVCAALDAGFFVFDSSAGGLGGCPFAPGAGGNLATEDLVYLLERSGLETGIDLDRLARASAPVLSALGRQPAARAQVAALARSAPE